ncbi:conjugal transfer protein TrbL family protein (plasmid) [Alicyclobacillus acidoterrestris]|uniref:conjugal transfer protein TrbL family protein n=1 Tax=Alicyclobacillus acidoterrestris TaxID=1450 RepID=UPI003F5306BE
MSWLANQFNNMITNLVQSILNDLLKLIVDILNAFLVNPTDMNALPGFTPLLLAIESLCTAALGFMLVKELFLNQWESLGDMDVPPIVIVKNTFFTAFLIWLSPLLIQQVILRLVVDLTSVVSGSLGSNLNVHLDTLLAVSLSTGAATATAASESAGMQVAKNAMLDALSPDLGLWAVVVIIFAIIVALAIIGIQSGMRWAELYFLALVGPILALNRVSFGNAWGQWLRETIGAACSQLVQYFSTLLALVIMVHPNTLDTANGSTVDGTVKIFMILGLLVFAVVGPSRLRGIIAAGNPTGMRAVASIAKSAAGGLPIGG